MPWCRAIAIWLVVIAAEIGHGIARTCVLAPRLGDGRARQIGVFSGALLNLGIACLTVRWIGATTRGALVGVGLVWTVLTVIFELAFGRWVARVSWERLRADYDLAHGGLLPIGLAALAGTPLVAARLRRVHRYS